MPRCRTKTATADCIIPATNSIVNQDRIYKPSSGNWILRLGKCQLNAYLHQIGKHPDGLCHSCNKPETVIHFITEW